MTIPKIIHYCWFGNNEKPELVKKCIKSWDILKNNGYKIIEWNEKNFDINECEYVKKAYENKKWAFVTDYVRLKVLLDYGGIYLDTDMEVNKTFDKLLEEKIFLSFMLNSILSTSIIGSEANQKDIKNLLDIYKNLDFEINPNNNLLTKYILDNYKYFKLNNKLQKLGEITVYPKEYLNNPTYDDTNYAVHRYLGSWIENNKGESFKSRLFKKIFGEVIFYKIISYKENKNSSFYELSLKQKRNDF